jgi:hypothetical protein
VAADDCAKLLARSIMLYKITVIDMCAARLVKLSDSVSPGDGAHKANRQVELILVLRA